MGGVSAMRRPPTKPMTEPIIAAGLAGGLIALKRGYSIGELIISAGKHVRAVERFLAAIVPDIISNTPEYWRQAKKGVGL